jgi:hypothetical protein
MKGRSTLLVYLDSKSNQTLNLFVMMKSNGILKGFAIWGDVARGVVPVPPIQGPLSSW